MYKNSTVTVTYFHYFFTLLLYVILEKNIGHQNVTAHGMFCSQAHRKIQTQPNFDTLRIWPPFQIQNEKKQTQNPSLNIRGVGMPTDPPRRRYALRATLSPILLRLTTSNLSQALKSWDFIRGGFRVSIFTCFDVFFFAAFVLEAPRTGGNFCGSTKHKHKAKPAIRIHACMQIIIFTFKFQ